MMSFQQAQEKHIQLGYSHQSLDYLDVPLFRWIWEKMDITYKGKWVNLKRNNFWLFWSHRLATWTGWQILRTFKTQLFWPSEMVQSHHPLPKSRVLNQVTRLIRPRVSADPEMLIQNSNAWPGLEGNKITFLYKGWGRLKKEAYYIRILQEVFGDFPPQPGFCNCLQWIYT